MSRNGGLIIVGGIFGIWLLANRKTNEPKRTQSDSEWMSAIFTEYHPDAPPSEQEMEGGPKDRKGLPVITAQQHMADKIKYPYISVSADLELRGAPVPYGTRIYFGSYPDLVFRIVDTGERFRGPKKRIRKPGFEPFDVATAHGSKLGFSGKQTVYRIDRSDILSTRKVPKVA